MIKLDFPIERLYFQFKLFGTARVDLIINNKKYKNVQTLSVDKEIIQDKNRIEIFFNKRDPADTSSYAVLEKFLINDGDFINDFKKITYAVDKSKHPNNELQYPNNTYFGRIGSLNFNLDSNYNLLKKAAWLIAENCFENPKENTRGNPYRVKNFKNIYEDFKYIFTGCLAPKNENILEFVDNLKIKDINDPIDFTKTRTELEKWINNSNILNFKNFNKFNEFNYGGGTINFLESFILRSKKKIFLAPKYYYFIGEIIKNTELKVQNLFEDIEENQRVLFEYPNPWYSNKTMLEKIKEARKKNCYIGLDLTWAPIATNKIELDLDLFDEVYFSMNKAWPINHIRPAWRWSKKTINDATNFQQNWNYYQKLQPNIFLKLIKKFAVDYAYKTYINDVKNINKIFNLSPTEVLWFTKHDTTKHDEADYISNYYFLDEFVCIRKLLDHKGKFFW
jgi:hypothetical protein